MEREKIFEYVKKQYGTEPEYLWRTDPESAVLRHKNGKWYGILMRISRSKLGLLDDDMTDILNVKCDPDMISMLAGTYGFWPGYHMNKRYWLTILLEGTVSEAQILDFLDMSYQLIEGKPGKHSVQK